MLHNNICAASPLIGLLVLLVPLLISGAAQPEVAKSEHLHRLMSDAELRRTFQVAQHDQVPEYQVLQMVAHRDGSHLISPVGSLSDIVDRHKRSLAESESYAPPELGAGRPTATATSDNRHEQSGAKFGAVRGPENKSNDLIVMKLSTFGKNFQLRLKRNADFQQRIQDMKMYLAESTRDGQLRYTEIKQQQQLKPTAKQQQVSSRVSV